MNTFDRYIRPDLDIWLAIGLFIVSLFPRLSLLSSTGFDGLYGQDPYAYYNFSRELLYFVQTGNAPGPFFWPVGYPLLLSLLFGLFGTSKAIAQVLSLGAGALLTPLVYGLTRQMGVNRGGAFTAAIVMTVCGQALQSSIVIMADIPALALATMSAFALWRYIKTDKRRWVALAAFLLMWASLGRWLYLALGVPWLILLLLHWRGRVRTQWRRILADCLTSLIVVIIIFLPQYIYSQFNPTDGFNHPWVQGWSVENAFQTTFTNIDGTFNYAEPNALFYAKPIFDPTGYYIAPLFSLLIIVGVIRLVWHRYWSQATLLLLWILLPYVFLAGIPYQNIRFPLIIFPAAAIVAGFGVDTLLQIAKRVQVQYRYVFIAILTVLIGLSALSTWQIARTEIDNFITIHQTDKSVAHWTAEQLPEGARLYTFGLTLTLNHYTTLEVYDLFYEIPATLAQRWRRGETDYLLLNVWQIENQWAGMILQANYHWLRDERGLERIGRMGNYTLFRIRG